MWFDELNHTGLRRGVRINAMIGKGVTDVRGKIYKRIEATDETRFQDSEYKFLDDFFLVHATRETGDTKQQPQPLMAQVVASSAASSSQPLMAPPVSQFPLMAQVVASSAASSSQPLMAPPVSQLGAAFSSQSTIWAASSVPPIYAGPEKHDATQFDDSANALNDAADDTTSHTVALLPSGAGMMVGQRHIGARSQSPCAAESRRSSPRPRKSPRSSPRLPSRMDSHPDQDRAEEEEEWQELTRLTILGCHRALRIKTGCDDEECWDAIREQLIDDFDNPSQKLKDLLFETKAQFEMEQNEMGPEHDAWGSATV